MDQKTFRQFVVTSVVVLALWYLVVVPLLSPMLNRQTPPPNGQDETEQQGRTNEADSVAGSDPEDGPAGDSATQAAIPHEQPEIPEAALRTDSIENEHIRTVWSNRGAALLELTMLGIKAPYGDPDEGERPDLKLLQPFQGHSGSDDSVPLTSDRIEYVTLLDPDRTSNRRTIRFFPTEDEPANASPFWEFVEPSDGDGDALVYRRAIGDDLGRRLELTKTITIDEGERHYNVTLGMRNVGERDFVVALGVRGPAGIEREELQTQYIRAWSASQEGNGYELDDVASRKLASLHRDRLEEPGEYPYKETSGRLVWTGVSNRYFVSILQPVTGAAGAAPAQPTIAEDRPPTWMASVWCTSVVDSDVLNQEGRWGPGVVADAKARGQWARNNASVLVNSVTIPVTTQEPAEISYRMLALPKQLKELRKYDAGMTDLVAGGFLSGISHLLLWLLSAIRSVVGSFGVSILVLTAIVRVVLHPLTRKSQVSMVKMQKLQPQINEIRRKYASDQKKASAEQMRLFREYGVNPMGGCLPMLLQLPIFIALFRALREAYVLRQAGFLYIDDLSLPDALFVLPNGIPFLGGMAFNLLPILWTALLLFQQKLMRQPAATEQARQQQAMFKWMPIVFLFILYKMPSGLCLYWVASTLIGLGERIWVERHAASIELSPVGAASGGKTSPNRAKKRAGFFGRLASRAEEYMKEQERRAREADEQRRKEKKGKRK